MAAAVAKPCSVVLPCAAVAKDVVGLPNPTKTMCFMNAIVQILLLCLSQSRECIAAAANQLVDERGWRGRQQCAFEFLQFFVERLGVQGLLAMSVSVKAAADNLSKAFQSFVEGTSPAVVALHISRFDDSGKKLCQKVVYQECMVCCGRIWKLFGLVTHSGSAYEGHYISYVHGEAGWIEINDKEVEPSSMFQMSLGQAFILFYYCLGAAPPPETKKTKPSKGKKAIVQRSASPQKKVTAKESKKETDEKEVQKPCPGLRWLHTWIWAFLGQMLQQRCKAQRIEDAVGGEHWILKVAGRSILKLATRSLEHHLATLRGFYLLPGRYSNMKFPLRSSFRPDSLFASNILAVSFGGVPFWHPAQVTSMLQRNICVALWAFFLHELCEAYVLKLRSLTSDGAQQTPEAATEKPSWREIESQWYAEGRFNVPVIPSCEPDLATGGALSWREMEARWYAEDRFSV